MCSACIITMLYMFSSDVNEECCNGCSYATSSTPCKTYPANSDTCLQNVTCSGLSGSCPSEEKFVKVTTLCQGSGLCLLADTQCNNRLVFSSADSARNYNLLMKGRFSFRIVASIPGRTSLREVRPKAVKEASRIVASVVHTQNHFKGYRIVLWMFKT